MEIKVLLVRLTEEKRQTLGTLHVFDETDLKFSCKALELPWLNNQKKISCIPAGDYMCKIRKSPKKGNKEVFLVCELDGSHVNGRTYIQIEWGNYHHDILGCILTGSAHRDIDGDGYRDVTSSRKTFSEFKAMVPDEFPLKIVDATELCL